MEEQAVNEPVSQPVEEIHETRQPEVQNQKESIPKENEIREIKEEKNTLNTQEISPVSLFL